ncbi:MAG: FtsX-like permease family protein, partial [Bacteroidota bacterium]
VFEHGLLEGNPATLLTEPSSIVLPKSAAIKYFGQAAYDQKQIIGRNILGGKDGGTPWKVTGIMADQPDHSHLDFEFLISSSSYPDDLHRSNNWSWPFMHTYLRTHPQQNDPQLLAQKLKGIVKQYALPFLGNEATDFEEEKVFLSYVPQRLTDIHLTSNYLREMHPNGNKTYVQIFVLTAFFILLIASVNYINLFIAQSTKRAKEIGIKKVIGATRKQLIQQFLAESFLAVGIATLLSLMMIELFRTSSSFFFSDAFSVNFINYTELLLAALVLMVVVGFVAGSYPAFHLTQFSSSAALKGKLRMGLRHSGVRNSLIVFQFVISIGLMVCTTIVNQQVHFFQSKGLGFQKENVLIIENDREIEGQAQVFKQALLEHSQIKRVSFSNGLPSLAAYKMREFNQEGSTIKKGINWYQMDGDHLATLNIDLVAGRTFQTESPVDSFSILINEATAKLLSLEDPIGKYLIKNQGADDEERLRIIGVIKDFHFESLHHAVKPLAIQFFKGFVFKDYISVRLTGQDLPNTIAHIEKTWKQFEPGVPLRYHFLEKSYDALFKSEQRLASVFNLFSGLAIIIACLGLFGLAAFITEQRTREIGIRKVLGASIYQIVTLLSQDFLKLVLIAALIASPIAWYLMNEWLQNFHYRVNILWWIFLVATVMALLIAALTVSLQSFKAALANPTDVLRSE